MKKKIKDRSSDGWAWPKDLSPETTEALRKAGLLGWAWPKDLSPETTEALRKAGLL